MAAQLSRLEAVLGYRFTNRNLLVQALTHRSHGAAHNERLEFLGDSVLNFVVASLLYDLFPSTDEGDLSRMRASLVRQATLADIATHLLLSDYLKLGEGELKSGGFRRPSILSDALEAVFGAVYMDGGFEAARRVIAAQYETLLANVDPVNQGKDAKTLLQERLQAMRFDLPIYTVIATHGAAHNQLFEVACDVPRLDLRVQASGSSRRAAEQAAAQLALEQLATNENLKGEPRRRKRRAQLSLPVALSQEHK
ncbi:ribonuclease III [Achromobacter sp. F4_2707]|uniref:ribonuclease III n=1 Tax=Achromobacter sp. F4_2707 TaxID=3114286 RepID=UPI0039C5E807